MRVLLLLFFLSCSGVSGTLMRVASGGPGGLDSAGNSWTSDSGYSGGFVWSNPGQAAPFGNLRYGTAFSYTFQVAPGFYSVILKFIEPNKTVAGGRLFSVSINGAPVLVRFDLFQVASMLAPYSISFPVTSQGFIQIALSGVLGNAVLSGIQIDDAPAPVHAPGYLVGLESDSPVCPAAGLTFFAATDTSHLYWCVNGGTWLPVGDVRNAPRLLVLERCSGSGPGWSCDGLLRAQVRLSDGSALSMVGVVMDTGGSGTWGALK